MACTVESRPTASQWRICTCVARCALAALRPCVTRAPLCGMGPCSWSASVSMPPVRPTGCCQASAWNRETPEATVAREMREETNLIVRVDRLLFDVPAERGCAHEREHTYQCTPIAGEAAPGHEPEPAFATACNFV